jgi:hypothetical protein
VCVVSLLLAVAEELQQLLACASGGDVCHARCSMASIDGGATLRRQVT